MILGFGTIVLGYALFYWGASHFCNCLGICWDKGCCQRYSLWCLIGLRQISQTVSQQTNQPLAGEPPLPVIP